MLFERCLQWAKEMDVTAVELNVWEFNEDAIAFYKGCGMETINRKMVASLYQAREQKLEFLLK